MTTCPLPQAAAERKAVPVVSGLLDYFPAALAAVAECSRAGNDQHNPGQPLHWDRSKSGDEADALVRHLMDRGTIDTDGIRHSTKVAWRALANLQKELEAAGAPLARGAVNDPRGSRKMLPLVDGVQCRATFNYGGLAGEAVDPASLANPVSQSTGD